MNQKNRLKSAIQKSTLILGSGIISWVFLLYFVSFWGLVFGRGIPDFANISFGLSSGITIIFVAVLTRLLMNEKKIQAFVLQSISYIFIIAVIIGSSIGISREFVDVSFDGNAYHGEALIQLAGGWNPVSNPKSDSYLNIHYRWLDGYPKASWINAVTLSQVTGVYEDGMSFNILYLLASFFVILSALLSLQTSRIGSSLLLSLLASCNLVVLFQLKTYYLDGQVSSLMVIIFGYFILLKNHITQKNWLIYASLLSSGLILLINTKLVGIVFAILMCLIYAGYLIFEDKSWQKSIGIMATAGVMGVIVFGYNPYITNIINYQHPLYPVLGPNRIDAYTQNLPSNYVGKSNFEVFASSFFFRSNSNYWPPEDRAELKIPLTFQVEEFTKHMSGAGPKVGGFGPLFGGVAILSLLTFFVLSLYKHYGTKIDDWEDEKNDKDEVVSHTDKSKNITPQHTTDSNDKPNQAPLYEVGLLLFGSIVSCIIISASNEARLFPQIWFIPVVIIFVIIHYNQKFLQSLGYSLALLLCINTGVSYYYNLEEYNSDVSLRNQKLEYFRLISQEKPLRVHLGYSTATRVVLDNAGVRYEASPTKINCNNDEKWESVLPELNVIICIPQ